MRPYVFILLLLLLLLCQGCEKSVTQKFEWENGTEYPLKFERYASDTLVGRLEGQGNKGVFRLVVQENENGVRLSAAEALRADSIVVTYDSTRRQIYYISESGKEYKSQPPVAKSIFDDGAYQKIGRDHLRFTFSKEDYANAALIKEE